MAMALASAVPPCTLRDEVWRGAIPCCFRLAGDAGARPLYAMVPRLASLGSLDARLRRHFNVGFDAAAPGDGDAAVAPMAGLADSQYFARPLARAAPEDAPADETEKGGGAREPLWFRPAGGGRPLRWAIPLGVAYDDAAARGGPARLPWALECVFEKPEAAPDAVDRAGAPFRAFFHALKQAVHLERGTARSVLSLPRVAQEALFAAGRAGDRSAFARADVASRDAPRRVPVRLIFPGGGPPVQLPFPPTGSLRDALAAPIRAAFGAADVAEAADVVAHGVPLPWDLPLLDAWRALHAADHFLYLVVVRR